MKKILSGFISKKLAISLLTLILLLTGLCVLSPEASEALASDSSTNPFKVEQLEIGNYTKKDGNNIVRTAPKPDVDSDYKDWIFAGWYKDATCKTTVGKTAENGTYYAKFVPSEVLSAKCQVSADTTSATSVSTSKLRIVSTVDSLKYSKVGFDIGFKGKTIEYSTAKVYSKIEAAADGVKYGFSPVIFDLQSEYFITATLINIQQDDFDEGILIKPYWVTKDGTKVYGVSRYARVEDSYLGIVNVPVRLYSDAEMATGSATVAYDSTKLEYQGYDTGYVFDTIENVDSTTTGGKITVSAKTSSGSNVAADGMLVNLRLKTKAGATLPKKNEFAVAMNSTDVYAPNVVYMNYITGEYGGTADESWYNTTDKTFVITTPEELYGLASLSATNSFSGQTVYLGADITIDSDWTASETGHSHPWTPIGTAKDFAGTFDGQGRTINGIYVNDTSSALYVGLFGQVSGTVQNLNLENSYVASNGLMTGSIAGYLSGNMRGVSSSAIVENTAAGNVAAEYHERECGGLVGRFGSTSEATISNCLFSGTVTSNNRDLGGIVGRIARGTKFIEHCLNAGTVRSNLTGTGIWAGGIIGGVDPQIIEEKPVDITLVVNDSLNTGTVSVNYSVGVGSVIGFVESDNSINITLKNAYATNQTLFNSNAMTALGIGSTSTSVSGECGLYNKDAIKGYTGYSNTDFALSFYTNANKDAGGYWITRIGDTPMLKKFADNWADYGWYNASAKEVEIETVQELYGFSEISQTDSFSGDTIKLVKDITINEGTASNWGSAAPKKAWTPIGKTTAFDGIFDGQEHTISGIYVNDTAGAGYVGLFAQASGTVKNFSLKNSYFASNGNMIGSVAGFLTGNLEDIYSSATVENTAIGNVTASTTDTDYLERECGGLVGRFGSGYERMISNSWFDGTVISNNRELGGIVGRIAMGKKTIKHCLNTGTVHTTLNTGAWVGGLVGSVNLQANGNGTLVLTDSMNVGKVTRANAVYVIGSVIGFIDDADSPTVTVENTYATNESYLNPAGTATSVGAGTIASGSIGLYDEASMKGYTGYSNKDFALSFYTNANKNAGGYWVTRTGDTPMLKTFADNWVDYGWYNTSAKEVEIETVHELYGFSEISQTDPFGGDTIKLVKDITVNEGTASNWGSMAPKKAWTPIGTDITFAGTFDGQGHTISGIYVNKTGDYSGLFAATAASSHIKDLRLDNSYIYGSGHHVGSIAGRGNGTFDKIYSDATVVSGGYNAGGIIGQMNDGANNQITNCWFDGSVTGNRAGGIVGFALCYKLTMTNCLNTGSVSAGEYMGGLCGARGGDGTNYFIIENCISAGEFINIASTTATGAIVGQIQSGKLVDVDRSYGRSGYSVVGSGNLNSGTVDLLSKEQFTGAQARYSTALGFYGEEEATDNWVARKGTYPGLKCFVPESEWYTEDEEIIVDTSWYNTANTEIYIDTAAKLYGLAEKSTVDTYWNDTIYLTSDITVNIGNATDWGNMAPKLEWEPIGDTTYVFAGIFDGQGHTISGIYVSKTGDYSGLFEATTTSSHIKDLRLENSYIYGSGHHVGSIAGRGNGTFDKIYSNATVVSGGYNAGGIIGQMNEGANNQITNCWYDGSVTGNRAGGIVGFVLCYKSTMTNCLNTGSVSAGEYMGGLCGARGGDGTNYFIIENCISAGEFINIASTTAIGALVGQIQSGKIVDVDTSYGRSGYSVVGSGNLNSGTVDLLSKEQFTGAQARYSTALGFYGEEEATDNWVAREGTYPGLKYFVPETEWYTDDETIIPDTSWYNVAKDTTNGSTFVIDTAAKLYGLAEKSKSDSYWHATVKLGADITVNIGDADEWRTTAPVNNWTPIGSVYAFTGTFDGQGHTIKGLYMNTDAQYGGLFAQVHLNESAFGPNSLRDFRMENSYFQSSASNLGSVAGELRVDMTNVYSDAIIVTSDTLCGGLVGQFNNFKTMSDCWFDGTVTSTCTEAQQGCGGLIGLVDRGVNKIENCLNTGDVTVTSGRTGQLLGVGGLVGMSINAAEKMLQLEITDCINAGVVSVDHPRGTGSVIGVLDNTTVYTNALILTNVYTTNQYVETSTQLDWTADICTGIGYNLAGDKATITGAVIEVSENDRFIGYAAYDTTEKLDFENTWVLRRNGVPALKAFVPETEQYTTVDTDFALSTLGEGITLRGNGLDAGDGSYVISVSDTDGSIYANYLAALNEKDFEVYASNDDGLGTQGVQNVVYTKAEDGFKWMVSVTHAGNEKQKTYVAISTSEVLSPHLKGAVTYTKDDAYTASGITPTLTMMKLTNTTTSGSSFVIQLSNGHFIINDGGFNDDLPNLIEYLKKLSNGQKPIVEAWVISHAHSDHVGAFEKIYTDANENKKQWADELYVEGIYYNESAAYIKGNFEPVISTNPETEGTLIYDAVYSLYYEKIQRGMALLKTTEGNTPEEYRYRTGQRFTFADVTMDVVQMEEQILDCDRMKTQGVYHDGSNGTSASVMFTINGKRVYIGGDEGYDNMLDFTANAYNDTYFNNLDVYVAPHHGSNTYYDFGRWCTNNGSAKFGMILFPCLSEEPPLWQNVSTETNYKLINQFTTDKTIYTYANGNVVLTLGNTISVSK